MRQKNHLVVCRFFLLDTNVFSSPVQAQNFNIFSVLKPTTFFTTTLSMSHSLAKLMLDVLLGLALIPITYLSALNASIMVHFYAFSVKKKLGLEFSPDSLYLINKAKTLC